MIRIILYLIFINSAIVFAQAPKPILTLNDTVNNRRGELYQIKFDSRKWKNQSHPFITGAV